VHRPPIGDPGYDEEIGAGTRRDQGSIGDIVLNNVSGQQAHADLIAAVTDADGPPRRLPIIVLEQIIERRGVARNVPTMLAMRLAVRTERSTATRAVFDAGRSEALSLPTGRYAKSVRALQCRKHADALRLVVVRLSRGPDEWWSWFQRRPHALS